MPAVVCFSVLVDSEIIASTSWAVVFAWLVTGLQLVKMVKDGECHGRGEDEDVLAAKGPSCKGLTIVYRARGGSMAIMAYAERVLHGSPMELWLAAIIGFSIGYLIGPLFYDH